MCVHTTHPEDTTEDEGNCDHNSNNTDDLDDGSDHIACVNQLLCLVDGSNQEESATKEREEDGEKDGEREEEKEEDGERDKD